MQELSFMKFLYILLHKKCLFPDGFVNNSNIIYLQNLLVVFKYTSGTLLMRKGLRSDFGGCESFLESNSPDILT